MLAALHGLVEIQETLRKAAQPLPAGLMHDAAPGARIISLLPAELRLLGSALDMMSEGSKLHGRHAEAELYADRARELREQAL